MTARVGNYLLYETLGTGAFGKVRQAVHEKTGKHYAIKIMDKCSIRDLQFTTNVRREIAIMKALDHPNIVSLHQVLTSPSKLYVVLDLVRGPELFEEIQQSGNTGLSESKARKYFQHLIEGVSYCHQRGVCHRDLKPENLLIDEHGMLKITDFGLSSMKGADTSTQLLTTQCGTPHYIAPEIISRCNPVYDGKKVDAWACGIILFALLAGYLPFDETDLALLFETIRIGRINFPPWISAGARDLIWRLLCADPDIRMSVHQVKQHPWFLVNYFPTVLKGNQIERAFPNRFRVPDPIPPMKRPGQNSTRQKIPRRRTRGEEYAEPKSLPIKIDVPTLDLPIFDSSSNSKTKRNMAKRRAISRRVREVDSVEPKSMPSEPEVPHLGIPSLEVPQINSPTRNNYAYSRRARSKIRIRESPEPQSLPLKAEIPSLELPKLRRPRNERHVENIEKKKESNHGISRRSNSASKISVEAAETAVGELVRLRRGMSFSKKFSLVRKGIVNYGSLQLRTFNREMAPTLGGEHEAKLRGVLSETGSIAGQSSKDDHKTGNQSDDEEFPDGTPSSRQTMCAIRSLQTVIAVSRSHFQREDHRPDQNDLSSNELSRDAILGALRRVRNKLMEFESQLESGAQNITAQKEGNKFLSKSERRDTFRLLNVWESIMLNDSQFPERIDDSTALSEEEMWAFQSLLRTWERQLAGNDQVEEVLIPGSVDVDDEHPADNLPKEFKDHQQFLRCVSHRRRARVNSSEQTNRSFRALVDSPISFESSASSSFDQPESFPYSKFKKRIPSRLQKIPDSSSPCTPHYPAYEGLLGLGNVPSNNANEAPLELRGNDLCDIWNQVLIANTSKLDEDGNPEQLPKNEEDEIQKDLTDRYETTEISEEPSIPTPTFTELWSSATLSRTSPIISSDSLRVQIDKSDVLPTPKNVKKNSKLTKANKSRASPPPTLTTESITPRTPTSLKWDPIHDAEDYEPRIPGSGNRRATSAFTEAQTAPEKHRLARAGGRRSMMVDTIPKPKRGKRGGGRRRWTVMGTENTDGQKLERQVSEDYCEDGESYIDTLRSTPGFGSMRTGSSFRATVGQSRGSREHKKLREPLVTRLFNVRGRYLVRFESQYDARTCLRELGALLKSSGFDVACKHGERKLRVSIIGKHGERQRIVSLEFRTKEHGCTVYVRKACSGWGRNRREEEGVLGQFCAHTVHNFKKTMPGVAVIERPRWNRGAGGRRR